eukprot:1421699-Amphidinium_carterae.1
MLFASPVYHLRSCVGSKSGAQGARVWLDSANPCSSMLLLGRTSSQTDLVVIRLATRAQIVEHVSTHSKQMHLQVKRIEEDRLEWKLVEKLVVKICMQLKGSS